MSDEELSLKIADWFLAHGFINFDSKWSGGKAWGIAWSQRSGYDFTDLEFHQIPHSGRPTNWVVVVGHHASGENPRMKIGECENLQEIIQISEAMRTINGYPKAEAFARAKELM